MDDDAGSLSRMLMSSWVMGMGVPVGVPVGVCEMYMSM